LLLTVAAAHGICQLERVRPKTKVLAALAILAALALKEAVPQVFAG
jgi:hypothetical protein